ncbi:MAG: hypothetical protein NTV01_07445 [Bacteroidia bacterium]|nr:hypothetical protein [Bacteroidia bacterium]
MMTLLTKKIIEDLVAHNGQVVMHASEESDWFRCHDCCAEGEGINAVKHEENCIVNRAKWDLKYEADDLANGNAT